MKFPLPTSIVDAAHQDFARLSAISAAIIRIAGSQAALQVSVGEILRDVIDDVIDTPRTGRHRYEQLEKTEKTYLGTRVEIRLRSLLGLPKGEILDLNINGTEVDIKFTIGRNWTIPVEAINHPCLLVAADEEHQRCFTGLIVARREYLNAGVNRDGKRSIATAEFKNILWLVNGSKYPKNFWRTLEEKDIEHIFSGGSGNERLARLFTILQGTPIDRSIVEAVAQQKDFMKRLRANGGVRDLLAKKGIEILSGKYNQARIAALGLPACDVNSFISFQHTTAVDSGEISFLTGELPLEEIP